MIKQGNTFSATTLVDLLEIRAAENPTALSYRFLTDHDAEPQTISYQELATQAKIIAVELKKYAAVGDRVLLIYPPGLALITAYFGCLYAGLVAVPAYPPTTIRLVEKIQKIILNSTPRLILSTQEITQTTQQLKWLKRIRKLPGTKSIIKRCYRHAHYLLDWDFDKIQWFSTDNKLPSQASQWQKPEITSESLAFLQYTSGSTDWPKGVMLTHHNLLHNLRLLYERYQLSGASPNYDKIVCWLPPYHDMGLIANILLPVYSCIGSTLFSPLSFIENPYRWLKAISQYQATFSGAPNFAYEYCTNHISDQACADINLSSWKIAFNGAEPIRAEVLENFSKRFAPHGFNPLAFSPCYGLAEATLFVTGDRATGWRGIPALGTTKEDKKIVINCGQPVQNVCIVDPKQYTPCAEGELGEVWVQSESVAQGYWGNPQATIEVFQAKLRGEANVNYLRTGDLGFLLDNHLYIAGRIKDLIIVHGVNHYPQDIEYTVTHYQDDLSPGGCAAFSMTIDNREQLVVICEIKQGQDQVFYSKVCAHIGNLIIDHHELAVHTIVLVPKKSLPKTTSGKIRRRYSKSLFINNEFTILCQWDLSSTRKKSLDTQKNKTPTELKLLAIYCSVFESKNIQLNDNFFALGGDSLSVMQLVAHIHESWEIDIDPHVFFEDLNVAEVAKIIDKSNKSPAKLPLLSENLPVHIEQGKVPLSFAQQRLWFIDKLHPNQSLYNLPVLMSMSGNLDKEALAKAIITIIERHEIL